MASRIIYGVLAFVVGIGLMLSPAVLYLRETYFLRRQIGRVLLWTRPARGLLYVVIESFAETRDLLWEFVVAPCCHRMPRSFRAELIRRSMVCPGAVSLRDGAREWQQAK